MWGTGLRAAFPSPGTMQPEHSGLGGRKGRQCNKNTKWANMCMFFEKIFIIIYMENIRLCDLKV